MLQTNFFRWALNIFLKRTSGDFNSFSEKTYIHDNDIVLIEDSENSYTKKKVLADVFTQIALMELDANDDFMPVEDISVQMDRDGNADIQPAATSLEGLKDKEFEIDSNLDLMPRE